MTDLAPSPRWSRPADEMVDEVVRTAGTMHPHAYAHGFVLPHLEMQVRETPNWLLRYATRLQELIDAGVGAPDWNGHGAKPLQREAVALGVRVLGSLLHGAEHRPFPWIVPTFRGGLQLEWHQPGTDLELDIDPNGSVEVLFTDHAEQKDWDGTLTEREWDVHAVLDRLALTEDASATS